MPVLSLTEPGQAAEIKRSYNLFIEYIIYFFNNVPDCKTEILNDLYLAVSTFDTEDVEFAKKNVQKNLDLIKTFSLDVPKVEANDDFRNICEMSVDLISLHIADKPELHEEALTSCLPFLSSESLYGNGVTKVDFFSLTWRNFF